MRSTPPYKKWKSKPILLFLTVVILLIALPANVLAFAADGVTIDKTSFPDDIFRSYVITNFDINKNGVLSKSEAAAVTKISVPGMGISSLKGIEHFINLGYLDCGVKMEGGASQYNQLTELDLSKNTALHTLICSDNRLSVLDLSKNTALASLDCDNNNISALDFSNNAALGWLSCSFNQLTSLNVTKNAALTWLDCAWTQLTELDVTNNTKLTSLQCGSNRLTALDVTKNTELTRLWCEYNQLTELDVSKNAVLTSLHCSNNKLISLDVTKSTSLSYLECHNNLLTSLDVSGNTALTSLSCGYNHLLGLDLSKNAALTSLDCSGNQHTVTASADGRLDLSTLHGFDVTKASGWAGGSTEGSVLTVDDGLRSVTYNYDCGNGKTASFELLIGYADDGDVICAIDETSFPDEVFRSYVKNSFDTNKDGFLSKGEAVLAEYISVPGMGIASLKGIEHFVNITYLDCGAKAEGEDKKSNHLTELDVSKNTLLTDLYCGGNSLTALDVSKNTALRYLNCNDNLLASLDVSQNSELRRIECDGNIHTLTSTGGKFDLSKIPGFDAAKASDLQGGTVDGTILVPDEGVTEVSYLYQIAPGKSAAFKIKLEKGSTAEPDKSNTVEPDESSIGEPEKGGISLGLIIGISAGVIAIIAVAVIAAKAKR